MDKKTKQRLASIFSKTGKDAERKTRNIAGALGQQARFQKTKFDEFINNLTHKEMSKAEKIMMNGKTPAQAIADYSTELIWSNKHDNKAHEINAALRQFNNAYRIGLDTVKVYERDIPRLKLDAAKFRYRAAKDAQEAAENIIE